MKRIILPGLIALMLVVSAWAIFHGIQRDARDAQACRDSHLVPVMLEGRYLCFDRSVVSVP